MRLTKTLLLVAYFHFSVTLAQEKAYELSKPFDMSMKGWNKVLCMKNGNTLLFHFEPNKPIIVKAFDTARKQKPEHSDHYKVLDNFAIEAPHLKGLFELNGEAVLFLEQERNARHSLVRMRYDGATGRLLEEKLVAESENANKRMEFFVIWHKGADHYEILFSTDIQHPKKCDIYLVYFDKMHQAAKELQLDVDRKKFDALRVLGAGEQPNGVLVTIALGKIRIYGPPDNVPPYEDPGPVYEYYLDYFYIPADSSKPQSKLVDVPEAIDPSFSYYTTNTFAGALNSLIYNSHPVYYQFGLERMTAYITSTMFLKIDMPRMGMSIKRLKDSIAHSYLHLRPDTAIFYSTHPMNMYTNENGLSTIVSSSVVDHIDERTVSKYDTSYFARWIAITQADDDGKEIWGTILPCNQSYKRLPIYSSHFVGTQERHRGKNFYIIFNDDDRNFNNTIKAPGYIINAFENTNAFYYRINDKKEVAKKYVFGQPDKHEFISCFMDATFFDEETGAYAALVQYKKGENVTTRMAWARLD